jgi:hypothetical protein
VIIKITRDSCYGLVSGIRFSLKSNASAQNVPSIPNYSTSASGIKVYGLWDHDWALAIIVSSQG